MSIVKYMRDMFYLKLQHFLPLLSSLFLSLAVVMVTTVRQSLVRVGHKTWKQGYSSFECVEVFMKIKMVDVDADKLSNKFIEKLSELLSWWS